jgi:hypothetical protein
MSQLDEALAAVSELLVQGPIATAAGSPIKQQQRAQHHHSPVRA